MRQPPPTRVAAVFPALTPQRAPLLDRLAARPEIDLTALYGSDARRVDPRHRAVFLRGLPVLELRRTLASAGPEVVVVSGWSTLASQSAIAWCRLARVPYVLVVEDHVGAPRVGWRGTLGDAVLTPIVQRAGGVLVDGAFARRAMLERGASPQHVRVFANTIDVEDFGARADRVARRREGLRESLGAGSDDVVVLSVGPLTLERRHVDLVHAIAELGDERFVLVLAGDGPERERIVELAGVRDVRLVVARDRDAGPELYAAVDVFALVSEREAWTVVVTEAAACGLPLLLSDGVGAAHDLLDDGENGVLVEARDVDAVSAALRRLGADPRLREAFGAHSRELARDWGYGPSVDGFLAAVREAVSSRR